MAAAATGATAATNPAANANAAATSANGCEGAAANAAGAAAAGASNTGDGGAVSSGSTAKPKADATALQPESWAQLLQGGQAIASGDKAEAERLAQAAMSAATAESALKRGGCTSAAWNPQTFRKAVRTYLTKRDARPINARRKPATPPKYSNPQLDGERQLERLMRTGGLPADPGFGRVGCWDRVLTRTWHEPPSESRPQQLTDLRDGLKGLGKEDARTAGAQEPRSSTRHTPSRREREPRLRLALSAAALRQRTVSGERAVWRTRRRNL